MEQARFGTGRGILKLHVPTFQLETALGPSQAKTARSSFISAMVSFVEQRKQEKVDVLFFLKSGKRESDPDKHFVLLYSGMKGSHLL
jgi:hypothetical protein